MALVFFCLGFFMHLLRLFFTKPRLQVTVFFVTFVGGGGAAVGLPAPLKDSLDGEPNPSGCGKGAGLHESALVQGGGATGAAWHGHPDAHTWAS